MNILAIETSCDDTCIAVVEIKNKKFTILSNIVSSQVEVHKKYGGVYPSLAKREHQKNLPLVLEKALKKAKRPKIDTIAVTVGPGLDPCLWTGINFAKELAKKWDLPIVPVNHIEAHLLINFIDEAQNFPAIALVVSGGHTQLILVKDIGKYKILGETRDDAAGECFDKVARILGFGYPGGPAIAKLASQCKSPTADIKLPRPMINQKNYDFSFSGLKTAVLYDYQSRTKKVQKSKEYIIEMAKDIQQSIVDVLLKKTGKAMEEYRVKSIILGGGVGANNALRNQLSALAKEKNIPLFMPPSRLCTDNGVMPAVVGYFKFLKKEFPKTPEHIEAKPHLRLAPQGIWVT